MPDEDALNEGYGEETLLAQAQDRSKKAKPKVNELFRRFAQRTSQAVGSSWAFLAAALSVVVWACSRPFFRSFDSWELVINTATTIVTFLMVFLIQNTQNRDSKALHLKLDELIRGVQGARTRLVELEDCTDAELDTLKEEFARLRRREERRGASMAPPSAE